MKKAGKVITGTLALTLTLGGGALAAGVANAASSVAATDQEQGTKKATVNKAGKMDVKVVFGKGAFMNNEALLELLGLTEDELQAKLKEGSSLAEIAEAQGVDADKVVDLLASAMTEKLDAQLEEGTITREQYDKSVDQLTERVASMVNGEIKAGFGFGKVARFAFANQEELLSLLGLTEDELQTKLKEGSSLAEIAEAQGVDADKVVSLLTGAMTEKLNAQLEEGTITQEQYDEHVAQLTERVTGMVNGEFDGLKDDAFGGKRLGVSFADNDALLDLLGLTAEELKAAVAEGDSLAAIAEEQGVDVDDVIALLVSQMTEKLQAKADAAGITDEQYEKMLEGLTARVTQTVNGTLPEKVRAHVIVGEEDQAAVS